MTFPAIFTISLLVITLVVMSTQRLRPDLVALLVMLALIISGVLSPSEAFSAFGQRVIIIVAGIYVLGAALYETGVATIIADQILRFGGQGETVLMLMIMLTAGLMSSVLSGLLVVAVLLPAVLRIARQTKLAPSRLLLPLATAATIGNQLTLIGTTSNLVVSDILGSNGQESLDLFTMTPYNLAILGVTMLWFLIPGRRFLRREAPSEPERPSLDEVERSYKLENLLYRLRVRSASNLISERLDNSGLRTRFHLNVIAIQPHNGKLRPARPDWILEQDDLLVVEGDPGHVLQAAGLHNLERKGTVSLEQFNELEQDTLRLAEIIVPFRSELIDHSLTKLDFRGRYGLNVLAVQQQDKVIRADLSGLVLQSGDSLLVQGPARNIRKIGEDLNLVLVTDLGPRPGDLITGKAGLTLAILGTMLLLVVSGLLSLATAISAAAVALILTGCLRVEKAYESINGSILVLIGAMLPLATALQQTGAAEVMANLVVSLNLGSLGSLLVLYLLTSLITQVIANSVVAALITPVAINLAVAQGVSPAMFAIAIVFGVNSAYVTALTDANNLFIKESGQYTLRDYLINGGPIFFLQTVVLMVLLTVFQL
jgi:di/tricarboxylate transporter